MKRSIAVLLILSLLAHGVSPIARAGDTESAEQEIHSAPARLDDLPGDRVADTRVTGGAAAAPALTSAELAAIRKAETDSEQLLSQKAGDDCSEDSSQTFSNEQEYNNWCSRCGGTPSGSGATLRCTPGTYSGVRYASEGINWKVVGPVLIGVAIVTALALILLASGAGKCSDEEKTRGCTTRSR